MRAAVDHLDDERRWDLSAAHDSIRVADVQCETVSDKLVNVEAERDFILVFAISIALADVTHAGDNA
jgi:hypothetical protein